jgi:hypothetical protein
VDPTVVEVVCRRGGGLDPTVVEATRRRGTRRRGASTRCEPGGSWRFISVDPVIVGETVYEDLTTVEAWRRSRSRWTCGWQQNEEE